MRRTKTGRWLATACVASAMAVRAGATTAEQAWWKPYSPPATERENVFAFTEKPTLKRVGPDRYEISFAVKGYCDATVAIVDPDPKKELVKGRGTVVRHLASGVLGSNALAPFQKNSVKQTIYWNGKDDLDWYPENPEKLLARVELGLKPEFDRLLGAVSPYNLPGYAAGIAASPEGVFVFVRGVGKAGHYTIRKFNHDGTYARTVFPPPANMPHEKLEGFWFVEYEPGRHAIIGANPEINTGIGRSLWLPFSLDWGGPDWFRPVVAGQRIYFSSTGQIPGQPRGFKPALYFVHTDGSSSTQGLDGRPYFTTDRSTFQPRLAASPDGRRIYAVGITGRSPTMDDGRPAVFRFSPEGDAMAEVFAGDLSRPGSDNRHFNGLVDVDTDAGGRVYAADRFNNRIQVFDADGKHLKTLAAPDPQAVQVHRKTGAVYVLHAGRVRGARVSRVTKFSAYPAFTEMFHQDDMAGQTFTLDSWSEQPRIWLGRAEGFLGRGSHANLEIWEETEQGFRKTLDFNERARKEAGEHFHGRWAGSNYDHVHCDPLREKIYYRRDKVFDLPSGRFLGHQGGDLLSFSPNRGLGGNSIAFDKRGYLHIEHHHSHMARVDPDRNNTEVPYDYGDEIERRIGAIRIPRVGKHPCGSGVNMRGEVAVILNVEIAPRMDLHNEFNQGSQVERTARGLRAGGGPGGGPHADFLRSLADLEQEGIQTPYISRQPGLPLHGGTVWTWDASGELREPWTVIAGQRVNTVHIDEDRRLYFSNARYRLMANGRPFLEGRMTRQGSDGKNGTFFTGTALKSDGGPVRFRCSDAPVRMEDPPDRPPDLSGPIGPGYGPNRPVWVEGAEWLYAGASPMKPSDCMCYQIRWHLDWFKRSYVPEYYRHSVGILDTAGNLVLHVGQYGNFDSGNGPDSAIPLDGDGIAMTTVRHVSGTDNFMVFSDWSERLVVLRLNYHAEATVPVAAP